jgi:hypothetical protein
MRTFRNLHISENQRIPLSGGVAVRFTKPEDGTASVFPLLGSPRGASGDNPFPRDPFLIREGEIYYCGKSIELQIAFTTLQPAGASYTIDILESKDEAIATAIGAAVAADSIVFQSEDAVWVPDNDTIANPYTSPEFTRPTWAQRAVWELFYIGAETGLFSSTLTPRIMVQEASDHPTIPWATQATYTTATISAGQTGRFRLFGWGTGGSSNATTGQALWGYNAMPVRNKTRIYMDGYVIAVGRSVGFKLTWMR